MKLAGYSAGLFIIVVTIIASVQSANTKYDLSDKNQFSFYFREQWETMFNTPQPVANPAKDNIVSLLATELYFQPCYTVARTSGHRYFKDRLWGMMHALLNCRVKSSVVLPPNPAIEDNAYELEFIQNSTYSSYTKSHHDISMEMKARKTGDKDPYRIYRITEVC